MMKVFLIFILSFSLFAKENFVSGEGRFNSQEEDSLGLVKKQLISESFRDIITKKLQEVGLDSNLFWESYQARFAEYFQEIEEKLKETYKVDDPKVSEKQKEAYSKKLRLKQLEAKRKFGRLSRVISSYTIKKISRSPQFPNVRYMKLEAQVNEKLLNQVYFKFTSNNESRQIKTLYFSSTVTVKGDQWEKIGVVKKSDFTEVLAEHWINWLDSNISDEITVKLASESDLERLKSYTGISESGGGRFSFFGGSGDQAFRDVVWLNVNLLINPKQDSPYFSKRVFEIEGDMILVDLLRNQPVLFETYPVLKKDFQSKDSHRLSSDLASLVYRIPLSEFGQLNKSISSLPVNVKSRKITVKNFKNIQTIFEIEEKIAKEGLSLRTESRTKEYSGKEAYIALEYQGEDDSLKKMLGSLNNWKLSNGKKVIIKDLENPYILEVTQTKNLQSKREEKRAYDVKI